MTDALVTTDPELPTDRAQAIEMLTEGHKASEVARVLDVNKSTLTKWKKDPRFRAALARARAEAVEAVRGRAAALATKALDTLAAAMDDPEAPLSVRVSAARIILERVAPDDAGNSDALRTPREIVVLARSVFGGAPLQLPQDAIDTDEDAT